MDIAVTGGSGRLGRALIERLLAGGHGVRNLDRAAPKAAQSAERFIQIDLADLPAVTEAIRGCDAVAHLAAYPGPQFDPPGIVYVNNTVASFNVLHAAYSLGIRRVCLASSINAIGGIGSRAGRFDYFPVDEKHPTYNQDDYSLGKWVMEQQADSFARRRSDMAIGSLRLHALPDEPPELRNTLDDATAGAARGLWGWTLMSEAARACELTLQAGFTGHEVFYIVAGRTSSGIASLELAKHAYPGVTIRGDLSGHKSFYDCGKAARLLNWVHKDV